MVQMTDKRKLIAKTVKKAKTVKAPAAKTGKISTPHLPDAETQSRIMNDDRHYGSGTRNPKSSLPRGTKRRPARQPSV